MKITFLGHQGWRFERGGRTVLLDPIREEIGNGRVGLPVWPARRLDFRKLGPLEAVIVSHEHADHFSLDTLAALPARCPIYISDLSSAAMASAIAELGFPVTRFTRAQELLTGRARAHGAAGSLQHAGARHLRVARARRDGCQLLDRDRHRPTSRRARVARAALPRANARQPHQQLRGAPSGARRESRLT